MSRCAAFHLLAIFSTWQLVSHHGLRTLHFHGPTQSPHTGIRSPTPFTCYGLAYAIRACTLSFTE